MEKPVNNEFITDALIERPLSFIFERGRYAIYPLSLGKMQLCSRLVESLGFDRIKTSMDLHTVALGAAKEERDKSLRLISYVTLPGAECLDETIVRKRIRKWRRMKDGDIATLLVAFLSMDNTAAIMKEFGIDKEEARLSKVLKAKKKSKESGSLSFGGKSIWGTLIDAACERYGWTYQYVLWGISFSALQLLLSDHIKTVLLSEKERKEAHVPSDGNVIKADDKDALEQFIKTHNWR